MGSGRQLCVLSEGCKRAGAPLHPASAQVWHAAAVVIHVLLMPNRIRRAALSKALVVTARRWAAVVAPEEADRLTPVVESLSQRCVGGVAMMPAGWSRPGAWHMLGSTFKWQPQFAASYKSGSCICSVSPTCAATWALITLILRSAAWWAPSPVRGQELAAGALLLHCT